KGKRREVRRMVARRSQDLLARYRRGKPVPEGCPLWKALTTPPTRWVNLAADARAEGPADWTALVALVHDIFGLLPFRPVTVAPAWAAWNDGTVVKLAQGIYEDRAFDRLPILADALEEAGCSHPDVLSHCRGPGPHVRGCWLVDLLLGKS